MCRVESLSSKLFVPFWKFLGKVVAIGMQGFRAIRAHDEPELRVSAVAAVAVVAEEVVASGAQPSAATVCVHHIIEYLPRQADHTVYRMVPHPNLSEMATRHQFQGLSDIGWPSDFKPGAACNPAS